MNNIFRPRQLFQLISAIFFETVREPAVLFWGIAFPVLMSLGLGMAFSKKSDSTIKVAVIEPRATSSISVGDSTSIIDTYLVKNTTYVGAHDEEPAYQKVVIPNEKLGNTIFLFQRTDWATAVVLLKRGNLSIIMEEKDGRIDYHFDPSNPDAELSYLKLTALFSGKAVVAEENIASIRPLTVSGTRYVDFLIPGLIAMGIMMSSLWGVCYGIIEKRSRKLLRRMVATPMKKSHLLIALITVRTAMSFVEGVILFSVAYWVFDFRMQGSFLALMTIFLAGNIAFAGISVLISSRTANTEVGNGLINLVNMPMMVLSGIFFSYHNFPDWCVPYIKKLPLTIMADDMRSVFIEGAGFSAISLDALILTAFGIVLFTIGLRIFKWH
jgi:ABC-type multidrug transport system permease subunit